jgi:hypothetical protein
MAPVKCEMLHCLRPELIGWYASPMSEVDLTQKNHRTWVFGEAARIFHLGTLRRNVMPAYASASKRVAWLA